MLIVMDKEATPAQIEAVVDKIGALGYLAQPMPGGSGWPSRCSRTQDPWTRPCFWTCLE